MGDTPTFSDALTAVRERVDAAGGIYLAVQEPLRLGALLLGTDLTLADVMRAAELWNFAATDAIEDAGELLADWSEEDRRFSALYFSFLVGAFTALQYGNLLSAPTADRPLAGPTDQIGLTIHVTAPTEKDLASALPEIQRHVEQGGLVAEGFTGQAGASHYAFYLANREAANQSVDATQAEAEAVCAREGHDWPPGWKPYLLYDYQERTCRRCGKTERKKYVHVAGSGDAEPAPLNPVPAVLPRWLTEALADETVVERAATAAFAALTPKWANPASSEHLEEPIREAFRSLRDALHPQDPDGGAG